MQMCPTGSCCSVPHILKHALTSLDRIARPHEKARSRFSQVQPTGRSDKQLNGQFTFRFRTNAAYQRRRNVRARAQRRQDYRSLRSG